MIKAVIDTNVTISAILAPQATPAKILKLALQGEFELILSPLLTQEIQAVLRYPQITKFMKRRGVALAEADDFLEKLKRVAINVPGNVSLEAIPDDPKDDMVLACGIEGQADFIVSGDRHLKDLKTFRGIQIVDPAAFLKILAD